MLLSPHTARKREREREDFPFWRGVWGYRGGSPHCCSGLATLPSVGAIP